MTTSNVIAIDGPSGVGKSTIARAIADRLKYVYIDTGAMFRALAVFFHRAGVEESEETKIKEALETLKFSYGESEENLVSINGENLTLVIREHYVSDLASRYSKVPEIRNYLAKTQKEIAAHRASVMEGRDIGTVIFPNAFLKIFLTATNETRAKRRVNQLKEKGEIVSLEQVIDDITKRDERDSSREIAPLIKADDAIEIKTDNLSIEEVISKITMLEHSRKGEMN